MEKNTYKYISFRQKAEFENIQNIIEESVFHEDSESFFELSEDVDIKEEKEKYSYL